MSAYLQPEQIEVLLRPIRPNRVVQRDGNSNLEAYDVRAHLTRIFGFARWSEISIHSQLLYEQPTETKNGKPAFKVAYRADRCIVICDQDGAELCRHHGSAVGEAIMPDFKRGDAHDFALKKAQSQALKRAAINLGDQFGLSLYAKGATGALIGKVVGAMQAEMHEPDVIEEIDPDATPDIEPDEIASEGGGAVVGELDSNQPTAERNVSRNPPDPEPGFVSDAQIRKIQTLFGTKGIRERDAKLAFIIKTIKRDVASSKEMTLAEAHMVIEKLEAP